MRIGIFTDGYAPLISGVVTSIVNLKEGLEELGHEVFIFTPIPNKNKVVDKNVIRFKGFPLLKKSLKGYRLVFLPKRHLKTVKKYNLDIIHIHTEFSMGKLGRYASKKLNIPFVYTIHTSYQDYIHHVSKLMAYFIPKTSRKLAFKINNNFTKKAAMTIVPSKKIYDRMFKLNHDGSFTIIPTGIDLKPFYKENNDLEKINKLKESLKITDDLFTAVLVSRVAKEKSIIDLVDAFIDFNKEVSKSVFYIIGDGPSKDSLDSYIKKNDASSYIKTLGFVKYDEVPLYYQIGDLFLNASTTETQGLTYIEALAASLPIIVRKDDVFDDFVKEGENGLFFNESKELTNILLDVYHNRDKLNKLKQNARESVNKYSKENYAKSVLKLYQDILKK